jgi:hypothetical protein
MIPKKHRQWMLLAGLLLFFVVIVAYQSGSYEPPPATAPQTPSKPATGRGAASAQRAVPVTDVKLELLQGERQGASEPDRNPFRFKPKPAPPPPPPVARNAPPPIAQGPVGPVGPPPPPPIPLRFIGLIDGQPRVGVMSDGRGNVFYGKEGDIIDGRYRVLRIGPESADLSYTDGRGRQTLRMSGQ